jgi:hypothetical protein
MPAFVAHVWPGDATLRVPPDAYGATSAGRGAGQRRLLTTSDPWSRCVAARSGARLARLTSSRDGVQPSAGTGNLRVARLSDSAPSPQVSLARAFVRGLVAGLALALGTLLVYGFGAGYFGALAVPTRQEGSRSGRRRLTAIRSSRAMDARSGSSFGQPAPTVDPLSGGRPGPELTHGVTATMASHDCVCSDSAAVLARCCHDADRIRPPAQLTVIDRGRPQCGWWRMTPSASGTTSVTALSPPSGPGYAPTKRRDSVPMTSMRSARSLGPATVSMSIRIESGPRVPTVIHRHF